MNQVEQVQFKHKLTFALLGMASLIGWNAILTAMDFFIEKYPKEEFGDVSFLFPIPLFFGNFIWGLLVPKLAERYSLTQRISVCMFGICIFMFTLTLIAVILQNNLGFDLCLLTTFIIGSLNSVAQNSSIGLASQVDGSLTGIFWTFTAVGGLAMNAAKGIMLATFGDNEDATNKGTFFYFGIATVLTLTAIHLQIQFVKSEYYLHIQRKLQLAHQEDYESSKSVSAISQSDEMSVLLDSGKQSSGQQLKSYLKKLTDGAKAARSVPLFLWIMYVQTFMLFPGISIFSKPNFTVFSQSWSILLLLAIYNIGDMVGKQISGKQFYNIPFLYAVVMLRFIFFPSFLLTVHSSSGSFFDNDFFAFGNMFCFAVTNGFATGGLMFLGPSRGKNPKTKELISFISSFSLTLGIACGSFLAPSLS